MTVSRASRVSTTGATSQAGHAAIELALVVGLLILPVAVLVLSLPAWVERQSLARTAAHELARALVVAHDPAERIAKAGARAREIATNHGVDPDDVSVCFATHAVADAPPATCAGPGPIARGEAVTAYVTVRLPTLDLPGLQAALPGVPYTARHTERVDLYRSLAP